MKRLKTMDDLRRYLADLIRRVEAGKVEASVAGKLGYLSSILGRIIEGGEIERRLTALEKLVKAKN